MTLPEAILHLQESLEKNDFSCPQCKEEHKQLLKWLQELEVTRKALGYIETEASRISRS